MLWNSTRGVGSSGKPYPRSEIGYFFFHFFFFSFSCLALKPSPFSQENHVKKVLPDPQLSVPKELWRLADYIFKNGLDVVSSPDLFCFVLFRFFFAS